MEDRKLYLLNASLLYDTLLRQTENNCLRRFLAFKIITNTMSFEDVINNRTFTNFRQIRNIFLAHKQENSFFDAFNASNTITDKNIQDLLKFMKDNLSDPLNHVTFKELTDTKTKTDLEKLTKQILNLFQEEFYVGFRISNNFLCTDKGQIKEISSSAMSGCFYRYNSSKELSILANFFISNLSKYSQFENALINFKIDYILHAVNMHDCIFKDTRNSHSIEGLFEVMKNTGIGDPEPLEKLKADTVHTAIYEKMRQIRNKLAGHMDTSEPLTDHLQRVKEFDIRKAYDFVNKLDKAVYDAAQTHIVIQTHYGTFNQKLDNPDIIDIEDMSNKNYF
ncbi:hypothetical protein L21SP5_00796 [Salinivirga cyanobacteriivorans]|uniref:Uncharacterized protein n=1 Tax=Salinivirga cyanobacteriivorans TaxID=1307839 RepID=A0A0S2HWM1_9BACT|nr:hypothetical protein [Salinivirga cyanobacteriivorans]ALO14467.1 hypothetical protein L21SP5_00796 [Salinivirga cyanobacteriivorans]